MKQMEVTQKKIGENMFYIKPFGAFIAANISGELATIIAPILGALVPLFGKLGLDEGDLMDTDMDNIMPAVSSAASALSGDKFERLVKKLLVDHRNVSVEGPEIEGVRQLDYDLCNEVFCGEIQDMYALCIEVVKINFGGFFKKVAGRFGSLRVPAQEGTISANTESSTPASSGPLN